MSRGRSGSQRRVRIGGASRGTKSRKSKGTRSKGRQSMQKGSRRQDLARLILSFGAPPKNPCMTRDGQVLRQWLKDLAGLLVPTGESGKGVGAVVITDDVITKWAGDAAINDDLVAAYLRASVSNCTADKRMCAFFAELAPAVVTASGKLSGPPVRMVTSRTPGGSGGARQGSTKTAIGRRIAQITEMIKKLAERTVEYKAILDELKADQNAAPPGRGPRKAKAAAQAKAKTPATSPAQSAKTDSSDWKYDD